MLRAAAKQPWEVSEDVLPGVMGAVSTSRLRTIKWASLRNTSTCAEGQTRNKANLARTTKQHAEPDLSILVCTNRGKRDKAALLISQWTGKNLNITNVSFPHIQDAKYWHAGHLAADRLLFPECQTRPARVTKGVSSCFPVTRLYRWRFALQPARRLVARSSRKWRSEGSMQRFLSLRNVQTGAGKSATDACSTWLDVLGPRLISVPISKKLRI